MDKDNEKKLFQFQIGQDVANIVLHGKYDPALQVWVADDNGPNGPTYTAGVHLLVGYSKRPVDNTTGGGWTQTTQSNDAGDGEDGSSTTDYTTSSVTTEDC